MQSLQGHAARLVIAVLIAQGADIVGLEAHSREPSPGVLRRKIRVQGVGVVVVGDMLIGILGMIGITGVEWRHREMKNVGEPAIGVVAVLR